MTVNRLPHLLALYRQTFGEPLQVLKLQGDGSDRQIFRILGAQQTVIGIIGAKAAENRAFIGFSRHFKRNNLPVPDIFAVDEKHGIYLETDLGDETLYERIRKVRTANGKFTDALTSLYKKALDRLPDFQITAGRTLDYTLCYQYPVFGADAIWHDISYFRSRFLKTRLDVPVSFNKLNREFSTLLQTLLEARHDYFLYRDFQSRNIVILNDEPWFIDYQSGRRGALQYDLASLLYDAKAEIPDVIREELVDYYLQRLENYPGVAADNFRRYYYAYCWIRIMQALAAFAYLAGVKGKRAFLSSIPPALQNVRTLLAKPTIMNELPELKNIFINLVNQSNG
ncbi:MAG TPA: phosphotransferase [bacterium]|nr:phosphotransferase [bacterium]HPN43245.1 phosphotransferase [bacterium]